MVVIGEMECEEHFKQVPVYHYIDEPLYNEILGITNGIFPQYIVKCMEKNLI